MKADDDGSRLPPPGARGELEELHAAISGLLVRLHAALGRERRFTAEASHQLRTPLGTILGQVEVALRRPRSQEEYERVLGVVRRQASDLTLSVEALMFLARSDADAPPPATEPIDLREWVPGFLAALASHPRSSDVTFQADPGVPAEVTADPPLMREPVGSLLDSALKYTRPGRLVVVRAAGGAGAVEDPGPSVPAADLPHVFDLFFRSEAVTGTPGSGLGLAVAARIAAAFGGRVTAEKRPGGGSRFAVTMPAWPDDRNLIPASPAR